MLVQHDSLHDDVQRLSELFEVSTEMLGAQRRPLHLAAGAVVSSLLVLAFFPLTSFLTFGAVSVFLVLAVYFVLVADGELARRGAEDFS